MNMNAITTKFVYSGSLRRLVYRDPSEFISSNIALSRQFNELIYIIRGPDGRGITQISALNKNGNFASTGYEKNYVTRLSSDETDSYPFWEETLALDGRRFISAPYRQNNTREKRLVISLCRAFSEEYAGACAAVVDIQLNYDAITRIISETGNGQKTFVFTERDELVYPFGLDNAEYAAYLNASRDDVTVLTGSDGQNELAASVRSDFSGFVVVTAHDEGALALPVTRFRDTLALYAVIIIAVILIISGLISRRISLPIRRIRNEIRCFGFDEPPDNPIERHLSRISEIDELDEQFLIMRGKLRASLENELQTRMLALQSQMNPHFLYNTLATIRIMGKEAGAAGIVSVCDNLSSMLRYISSLDTKPVEMSAEIGYTRSYVDLMRFRYPDKLMVEFDIPAEMHDVFLPRLVIQPLVENSIKHGTNIYPPWIVSISGQYSADGWRVFVRDNGDGFSDGALADIERKIAGIDEDMPSLGLDGMGIVNICARMTLCFGEKSEFSVRNMPEGGAEVIIGVKT
jgi:two-component system sensor histidine kinase YesM